MSPRLRYRIDLPMAAWSSSLCLVEVEPTARKALREHVERFARYFMHEMHFNGIQFEAAESPHSVCYVRYKAFLFAAQGRYVGAACFRYRDDQDPLVPWLFDWLWLHPFVRRRGHLTRAWPQFIQTFNGLDAQLEAGASSHGDSCRPFRLAHPLSSSMAAFVSRIGWDGQ